MSPNIRLDPPRPRRRTSPTRPARPVPDGVEMPPELRQSYEDFVWARIDPKVKALGSLGVRQWAFLKIIEEAGEIARLDVRQMHGIDQDQGDYWKELGDLKFAVAALIKSFGMTEDLIEEMNRIKLNDRGDYATYLAAKEGGGALEDRP
jgi:hypothetical protein